MTRPFTGFHMLCAVVAFFTVVISVNMVMATLATRTFGGTVVDNSYVASQKFNRWLDEARAQSSLDWQVNADRRGDHAHLAVQGIDQAIITANAIHPLGRLPAKRLRFERVAPGQYRSREALPAGRWRLEIRIARDKDIKDFVREIPA